MLKERLSMLDKLQMLNLISFALIRKLKKQNKKSILPEVPVGLLVTSVAVGAA